MAYIGVIHKCFRDGLPKVIIRFLRGWLSNRTLRVRIGEVLSKEVPAESGVPQGSVLSPLIWNYWMGDCPTNLKPQCATSLYADDTSVWATNTQVENTIDDLQQEIWALTDWTATKRIKFEPKKTYLLGCHRDLKKRKEIKTHTIYLNRDNTEPLNWVPHAKLLGLTFSETGTFHHHLKQATGKCMSRIRNLWRFSGYVPGPTLMKVYRTAIEPILLYATEVIYETLTPIVLKRLLAVEYAAIRIAFKLDRNATIAECLTTYQGESIITRLDRRRTNFVLKNANNPTIRHTESLKTNQGRHLRIRKNYIDKHSVTDWKRTLYTHKPWTFFSEIDTTNYAIPCEHDPTSDIIRNDRLHNESILEHIGRTQNPEPTLDTECSQQISNSNIEVQDRIPHHPPPKFTLRRWDNGETIKTYKPGKLNLRLRKNRRNAPSSDSELDDSDDDSFPQLTSNSRRAFPPNPYHINRNPKLTNIKDAQLRIATEINDSRSRAIEWKRNTAQLRIGDSIIQSATTYNNQIQDLDHTYALDPPPKTNLQACWDTSSKTRCSTTPYPWSDSEDEPTNTQEDTNPYQPTADKGNPTRYSWSDSEEDEDYSTPNSKPNYHQCNTKNKKLKQNKTTTNTRAYTRKTFGSFLELDSEEGDIQLKTVTHSGETLPESGRMEPEPGTPPLPRTDYFPWDDSDNDDQVYPLKNTQQTTTKSSDTTLTLMNTPWSNPEEEEQPTTRQLNTLAFYTHHPQPTEETTEETDGTPLLRPREPD